MPGRLHILIYALCLCLLATFPLSAQRSPRPLSLADIRVEQTLNWEEGVIYLDIHVPISEDHSIFPLNRIASEKFAMDNLEHIIQDSLISIPLDSQETIGSYLQRNPSLILSLRNTYKDVWRSYSRVSSNFQNLSIRYTLPLYPHLTRILISHKTAYKKPMFIPNSLMEQEFSGIVIYVKQDLPLAGSFKGSRFLPSLFPRIYDENLNLFFGKEMVDPKFAHRWGIVSYTTDPLLRLHKERVGGNPFFLFARALYGVNPTDLVISLDDIQKIVSLESNKDLLKEGRIVFVLEKDFPADTL